jgi:hypothetical protein
VTLLLLGAMLALSACGQDLATSPDVDPDDSPERASVSVESTAMTWFDNRGRARLPQAPSAVDGAQVPPLRDESVADPQMSTGRNAELVSRLQRLSVRRSRRHSVDLELQRRTSVTTIEIQGVRKLEVVTVRSTASRATAAATPAGRLSGDGEPETVYFCDEYCFDDFIDEVGHEEEEVEASQAEVDDALTWLAAVDYLMTQAAAEAEAAYLGEQSGLEHINNIGQTFLRPAALLECDANRLRLTTSFGDPDCTVEWGLMLGTLAAASAYAVSYGAELLGPPPVQFVARVSRAAVWRGRANMIGLATTAVGAAVALKRCLDGPETSSPGDWSVRADS